MTVSDNAIVAIFAQETDEAFPALLTIEHPTIDPPIRVCLDGIDLVSRGNTFVAYPFDIRLPGSSGNQTSKVQLRIDNVDRMIVEALRTITTPPTVTLEVVLGSSPDIVEAGPFAMTLRTSRTPNPAEIFGELAYEDVLNQPWPKDSFTPSNFPGLF